jgi:hypothetical protein
VLALRAFRVYNPNEAVSAIATIILNRYMAAYPQRELLTKWFGPEGLVFTVPIVLSGLNHNKEFAFRLPG